MQRLRTSALARPHHGVRSTSDDRLAALVPLMRADHAFTGPTAAKLHGLPLPRRLAEDARIHVVAFSDRRMRRPGVVGTRSDDGRIVTIRGYPVLDPVSTWMSLAGLATVDDLVVVADRIVTGDRGVRPMASIGELDQAIRSQPGRRHVRDLRAALPWVRVGAWSAPETLLRLLIIRAGLPEPELNMRVVLRSGEVVRPDLSWAAVRVAVEYDGSAFHRRDDWDRDALRHERLVDDGWLVVRVRADDLFRHPEALAERLRRRLASRTVAKDPTRGTRQGRT